MFLQLEYLIAISHRISYAFSNLFSPVMKHYSYFEVRQLRRGGRIGEFVSVYLNPEQKAVYIASDGGRVCRPLLVLEAGMSLGSSRWMVDNLHIYYNMHNLWLILRRNFNTLRYLHPFFLLFHYII